MTVQELIDRLEDLDAPDAQLRFAYQPEWPLQDKVAGVWFPEPDGEDADGGTPTTVYIVSGGHDHDHPYAPSGVFQGAW